MQNIHFATRWNLPSVAAAPLSHSSFPRIQVYNFPRYSSTVYPEHTTLEANCVCPIVWMQTMCYVTRTCACLFR